PSGACAGRGKSTARTRARPPAKARHADRHPHRTPQHPQRRRPGGLEVPGRLPGRSRSAGALLFTGVYDVTGGADGTQMFWLTRVPRTAALVLAGAAMSMAGLVMQLLTQNRFVEPTTTGTTEWAGLGLLVIMIVMPSASIALRMTAAVVAAFIGTMGFFLLLRRISLRTSLVVPIV